MPASSEKGRPCDEDRWVLCKGKLQNGSTCNKKLAKRLPNGVYEAKKKGFHGGTYAGWYICTRCGHRTDVPLTGSPKRAPSRTSLTSPMKGREPEAKHA